MTDLIQMYNTAEKLKDAGKYDESVAILNELLTADANHVLSHLTLARIYTLQKKFDLAIEHSRKACDLEPNEAFNFTAMSVTYQRTYAGTGDTKYIQLAEEAMAYAHRLQG